MMKVMVQAGRQKKGSSLLDLGVRSGDSGDFLRGQRAGGAAEPQGDSSA